MAKATLKTTPKTPTQLTFQGNTARALTAFAKWKAPTDLMQIAFYWETLHSMADAILGMVNRPRAADLGCEAVLDDWLSGILGRCEELVALARKCEPRCARELEAQTALLLRHEILCSLEEPLALAEITNRFILRAAALESPNQIIRI